MRAVTIDAKILPGRTIMIPIKTVFGGLGVACMAACIVASSGPADAQTAAPQSSSMEYQKSIGSEKLSPEEVNRILDQAEKTANETASGKGLRSTDVKQRPGRFHIFVVDRKGRVIDSRHQADAWVGSIDIAVGKARTAAFFSSDENALTSRDIGNLSQAHGADGTGKAGPLWGIGETNHGDGKDGGTGIIRNTLVTFPGGVPLYKNGHLAGAIGVSGDGVDQDEAVAFGGADGFLPGAEVGKVSDLKPQPVEKIAK
jgi:uncharacterized protein GlcG (DUF336 family)